MIASNPALAEDAPRPQRVQALIDKGAAYLRGQIEKAGHGGRVTLAAYALLKSGEKADSPRLKLAVDEIRAKLKTTDGVTTYNPQGSSEGVYEAGIDLMFLTDLDTEAHLALIQSIAEWLVAQQHPDGFWSYLGNTDGDTSISQYAILGLWAAARAGIDIPLETWNKAAAWHIRNQSADGGFAYHPGKTTGPEGGASGNNMTNAGTGSLLIIRLHLFPEVAEFGKANREAQKKQDDSRVFGVLEAKDEDAGKLPIDRQRAELANRVALGQVDNAIRRGLGWIASRFLTTSPNQHKTYYYYTLERVGALANIDQIGTHKWYDECLPVVEQTMLDDGSWKDSDNAAVGTSFALLFLTRSTGKILKRPMFGAGLLTGGRGLPEDLANAEFDGTAIKERKMEGPLDELLSELSKLDPDNLEAAQAAIVEKVQIGNREELLGQIDQIRKLITHTSPDVRRTAIWALGRSGDLKDANLLIKALQDNNVDVLIEAYNALCYLSRKITGVGIPSNPLDSLPVNPSQAQMDAAVNRWRDEATKRWTAWYLRIRPYNEKNDLFQLQFGAASAKK